MRNSRARRWCGIGWFVSTERLGVSNVQDRYTEENMRALYKAFDARRMAPAQRLQPLRNLLHM